MVEIIQEKAQALGFARAYFLPPVNLTDWRKHALKAGLSVRLETDIPTAYPWATCVILLVYPYSPFAPDERIPAYYVAHNTAYHAATALAKELEAATQKRFAHVSALPLRTLALNSGVGVQGKNGLLRVDPYGSRIALFALLTDACTPFASAYAPSTPCPEGCTLCVKACPTGAIGAEAIFEHTHLTQQKCMRYLMYKMPYPEWVYPLHTKHIGCEVCMDACPFNRHIPRTEPSQDLRDAFDLDRLIAKDTAAATKYIGKNMKSGERLVHEAYYFKNGEIPLE